MYDISAANLVSVRLEVGRGGSIEFNKKDFSADTNPVRIERASVSSTEIDMNKRLFASRVYRPVRVVLTPIPNTLTDVKLKTLLLDARLHPNDSYYGAVNKMVVTCEQPQDVFAAGDNVLTLEDGFIVVGNLGIEVMAEGRYGSTAYEFEFADIDGKLNWFGKWTLEGEFAIEDWRGKRQAGGIGGSSNGNSKRPRKPQLPRNVQNTYYFGSNSKGQEVRGNWYNGNVISGRVVGR